MSADPDRCPICDRGRRVWASYTLAGLTYDDSYCGRCGRNWPGRQFTTRREPEPEPEPERQDER